ncbi:MAG: hypothetical protein U1C57_00455 [Candidatus Doudnabacteria bacterium]|nr:hypothetical protein [bacterium]MDZ4243561.1 hypothetical protein [Candidatus Doudnabacteria bacterium]
MIIDKQKGFINKNLLMALAGAVILLLALVIFWQKPKSNDRGTAELVKKELAPNEAPAGFPAEIPIEEGAVIAQNYEVDAPDGRHQATRVFISTKTVSQNYQIYSQFLSQNDWEIISQLREENYAALFAAKDGGNLSISISKNSITGAVKVDLSAVR